MCSFFAMFAMNLTLLSELRNIIKITKLPFVIDECSKTNIVSYWSFLNLKSMKLFTASCHSTYEIVLYYCKFLIFVKCQVYCFILNLIGWTLLSYDVWRVEIFSKRINFISSCYNFLFLFSLVLQNNRSRALKKYIKRLAAAN